MHMRDTRLTSSYRIVRRRGVGRLRLSALRSEVSGAPEGLSRALKRVFVVAFIVQAKAWTYLRNNRNS